jgi:ion channel-forming bestrophin family protein
MITYNPKEWFSFIFKFHKADTFRKLFPLLIAIGVYCAVVCFLEEEILHLAADSKAAKISVMHSLLGFVISLLLVFRTNTAYERWWEGRKLWGALVNCSRNMSVKIHAIFPEVSDERSKMIKYIRLFPFALKNHLRGVSAMNQNELFDLFHITELKSARHTPLKISNEFYTLLIQLNKSGKINSEQLLILNAECQQWLEISGACERIKNTPIPFSYSVFLKKFIFFYVMTLPIAYAPVLHFYSIPIVIFILYVLASLELIAEEIEDPFSQDANDLPLDEICKTIGISIDLVFNLKESQKPTPKD